MFNVTCRSFIQAYGLENTFTDLSILFFTFSQQPRFTVNINYSRSIPSSWHLQWLFTHIRIIIQCTSVLHGNYYILHIVGNYSVKMWCSSRAHEHIHDINTLCMQGYTTAGRCLWVFCPRGCRAVFSTAVSCVSHPDEGLTSNWIFRAVIVTTQTLLWIWTDNSIIQKCTKMRLMPYSHGTSVMWGAISTIMGIILNWIWLIIQVGLRWWHME